MYLDRSDHDVDGVVLHVHPREIARLIVVGAQRLCAQREVVPEARILGERRGLFEASRGAVVLRGEELGVRDRSQPAAGVAAHHRIK